MPLPDFKVFSSKIERLRPLIKQLPLTVPNATQEDRIYQVFQNLPVGTDPATHWETFNRRMDSLFGNELRGETGRLLHVMRGPYGMDLVIKYFDNCVENGTLNWDLATIKVDRLLRECEEIITAHTNTTGVNATNPSSDDEDGDYVPPVRPPKEPESPRDFEVFDDDGNEIVESTEAGEALESRRKAKKIKLLAKGSEKSKPPEKKTTKKTKGKPKNGTAQKPIDIDSGDESDGQSALRKVQEAEARTVAARPGPQNQSMRSFYPPVPVKDKSGAKRWEFRCRSCPNIRTVERTVSGENITFDDEETCPKLNNLATHMSPQEAFEDELRRYLRFEGGRGSNINPLLWWKQHEGAFPTIARMARDYLAIPGTSVSVERVFSKSRHICSDLRMSMKASTISEALLTKVWIGSDLFDVHAPLKRKRKHGKILD